MHVLDREHEDPNYMDNFTEKQFISKFSYTFCDLFVETLIQCEYKMYFTVKINLPIKCIV